MNNCPNCKATIGYIGTAYICPSTRAAAPPHQPGVGRPTRPNPIACELTAIANRGHRARKRRHPKQAPPDSAIY